MPLGGLEALIPTILGGAGAAVGPAIAAGAAIPASLAATPIGVGALAAGIPAAGAAAAGPGLLAGGSSIISMLSGAKGLLSGSGQPQAPLQAPEPGRPIISAGFQPSFSPKDPAIEQFLAELLSSGGPI